MLIMIATRAAGIQKSAQSYKDEKERMQERRLSNENLLDTLDDLGLDNEEEESSEEEIPVELKTKEGYSKEDGFVVDDDDDDGELEYLSSENEILS